MNSTEGGGCSLNQNGRLDPFATHIREMYLCSTSCFNSEHHHTYQ